jgi:hypothetical protein
MSFVRRRLANCLILALDLIVVNRVDDSLTKRTVHKREMAQLVRMVMEAALQDYSRGIGNDCVNGVE